MSDKIETLFDRPKTRHPSVPRIDRLPVVRRHEQDVGPRSTRLCDQPWEVSVKANSRASAAVRSIKDPHLSIPAYRDRRLATRDRTRLKEFPGPSAIRLDQNDFVFHVRRGVQVPTRKRHPEIDAVGFCEHLAPLDQVILIFLEDKRISFTPQDDMRSSPCFAFGALQEVIRYLTSALADHFDLRCGQDFVAVKPPDYLGVRMKITV
jgi:hypothetical protein